MAAIKYGEQVMKAPIQPAQTGQPVPSLKYSSPNCGVNAGWDLTPIIRPLMFPEVPIKQNFPQFLFFLGGDPRDIRDFEAEIDVSLGIQREKHTISSPAVLYIPPGLVYGPIDYKKVGKPILLMNIRFDREYLFSEASHRAAEIGNGAGRYSKYLLKAPVQVAHQGPPISTMRFFFSEFGVDATCILVPVLQPRLMEEQPHKHNFHQFLCFSGGDPLNIGDFGAEIEVWLGEEGEKHTITSPTILYYPPGLVHNPLYYKKVDKPVFHLDIYFASEYVKIPVPR